MCLVHIWIDTYLATYSVLCLLRLQRAEGYFMYTWACYAGIVLRAGSHKIKFVENNAGII